MDVRRAVGRGDEAVRRLVALRRVGVVRRLAARRTLERFFLVAIVSTPYILSR
ncbi:MAG: hypothetical protein SGI97_09355 [candidate division Zixibacteria bacterium]|nr:hypothetical protein [candidate division Zixibacteria bacterium]